MSMSISIYAGKEQEKPSVEVIDAFGSVWLQINYPGHNGLNFHGRSRAQCERLAAAWLAMWDEPAREFDDQGMYKPDATVQQVWDSAEAIHPEDGQPLTYQEEREEREERERGDAGLADELDQ
jgi:hypothetical protein